MEHVFVVLGRSIKIKDCKMRGSDVVGARPNFVTLKLIIAVYPRTISAHPLLCLTDSTKWHETSLY